jgi:hypothetical protein
LGSNTKGLNTHSSDHDGDLDGNQDADGVLVQTAFGEKTATA